MSVDVTHGVWGNVVTVQKEATCFLYISHIRWFLIGKSAKRPVSGRHIGSINNSTLFSVVDSPVVPVLILNGLYVEGTSKLSSSGSTCFESTFCGLVIFLLFVFLMILDAVDGRVRDWILLLSLSSAIFVDGSLLVLHGREKPDAPFMSSSPLYLLTAVAPPRVDGIVASDACTAWRSRHDSTTRIIICILRIMTTIMATMPQWRCWCSSESVDYLYVVLILMTLFSFVLKAFWLVSGGKAPSLSSKPLLSPVCCALIEGRLLCAVLPVSCVCSWAGSIRW